MPFRFHRLGVEGEPVTFTYDAGFQRLANDLPLGAVVFGREGSESLMVFLVERFSNARVIFIGGDRLPISYSHHLDKDKTLSEGADPGGAVIINQNQTPVQVLFLSSGLGVIPKVGEITFYN